MSHLKSGKFYTACLLGYGDGFDHDPVNTGNNGTFGDGWGNGRGNGRVIGVDDHAHPGRPDFFACPDPSDLAAALVNALVRPT